MSPLDSGDLLTVQQVLQIVPIGRTLLYQLVDEGQIQSIRVQSVGSKRGRILIFRSAVDEYVRRQEAHAPAPRRAPKVSVDELRDRIRTRRRTNSDVGSPAE